MYASTGDYRHHGEAMLALGLLPPSYLWQADFDNSRFYFNGTYYTTVSAFAAALGGTNSGNALSIGPHQTGDILYQSDFSSGIDGWVETTNPDNGSMAASSGDLVATVTTGQYRVAKEITVTRKAILAKATRVSSTTSNPVLGCGGAGGLGNTNSGLATMSANGSYSTVGATSNPTGFVGFLLNGAGALTADTVSAEVVIPYPGFVEKEVRFEIDFTSPASFASQKVLAQWGITNATGQSARVLINTSGELRVIVNTGSAEVANLNLGVISTTTRYLLRASLADNAFHANLDGGPLVSDTGGNFPPVGLFWLDRSFTGETFDGTPHLSTVWATAVSDPNMLVDPARALFIAGDSTGAGTGATAKWFDNFGSPVRAYSNIAVGGETSTQILARVQAAAAFYHDWPLIIMDRPNTGEDAALWLANMKAAGAAWGDKWFIMPPAQDVPDTSIANIATVQAALLSDPDFAGHTLGAVEQVAYLAAVDDAGTRSDGRHFDDDGQAIQQSYIEDFMHSRGW